MAYNTLIHTEKWQGIRRRLYFPADVDEYGSSSQSLTDLTQEVFNTATSDKKRTLKTGYIADICRDGGVAPCALILGLIYVKRLTVTNPTYLSSILPSDLFLVSMVVASKYLQDEGEVEALINSEWAEIGQRPKTILDKMERDFLSAIDWKLFVSEKEYDDFVRTVEGRIAMREAKRRGWWSYSDLCTLWETTPTTEVMTNAGKQTTKVIGNTLGLYVMCITTLLSSSQNMAIGITGSDVINTGYISHDDKWSNCDNDSINKVGGTHLELLRVNGSDFSELKSFKYDWLGSTCNKNWSESDFIKNLFDSNGSNNNWSKFNSLLNDLSESKVEWSVASRNWSESHSNNKWSTDSKRSHIKKYRSTRNGTLNKISSRLMHAGDGASVNGVMIWPHRAAT